MERMLQNRLVNWKNKSGRLPLIIRGARQVGKTWLMKWLGENYYKGYAYFNFDERPELNEFFDKNKDIDRIVNSLSHISGLSISDQTLIIFDEIQECPEALNTLKYFAEKRPELHVLCAGSLLGIMLHPGYSFPVGKVEFMTLYPLSFREVLPYWDEKSARFLDQLDKVEPIPELFYNDLLDFFKKYLVTGGLPAVVNAFNRHNTFEACESILENLILSYRGDFAKYPVMSDVAKIGQVFDSLPGQLARENKKFVYKLVRTGARAREYEDAIQWLVRSGLVHQVKLSTKPGIPLSAYDDLSAFKLYALDVGVIRRMARLAPSAYAEGNRLFTEFKGAMLENYILQSLVTQCEDVPRYWTSGNTAEVDFLFQHGNDIIPVEVKSDENVKSRSLAFYHQKFKPEIRIRYSLKNLSFNDGMLNIPHFMSDYTLEIIKLATT
ncbi:MAG: AAA family ATPase [Bacteroidales bacterium]|jgi:predicted AAA+ superfamily ATPase|nr:AAA family ATPase [Bacteroidales bacterium]